MLTIEDEIDQSIIDKHTKLDINKSISYLPIHTVKKYYSNGVEEYINNANISGLKFLVIEEKYAEIDSGAVYLFHEESLKTIIEENISLLKHDNWPTDPEGLIRRLASKWLSSEDPVLPFVRRIFGDENIN